MDRLIALSELDEWEEYAYTPTGPCGKCGRKNSVVHGHGLNPLHHALIEEDELPGYGEEAKLNWQQMARWPGRPIRKSDKGKPGIKTIWE